LSGLALNLCSSCLHCLRVGFTGMHQHTQLLVIIIIIIIVVVGFELRASYLLGRCSTSCATTPALFCVFCSFFFEIGSCKLFPWADFKPASQVARITSVSHWCLAGYHYF
jgi:hypothetical protein